MNQRAGIGVIVALPIEARGLARHQQPGMLVQVAGIGARRASLAAAHLIAQGVTALVSWGTAGGLAPATASGQLILPDHIIDAQQQIFPVDRIWRDRLQACLAGILPIQNGGLLQADHVIATVAEKQRLFAQYRAVAVDMESAAIAAVAHQHQVPFLAVRSIVDGSDAALPIWLQDCVTPTGALRPWLLFRKLGLHPTHWQMLFSLASNFRKSRFALVKAAAYLCRYSA